MKKTVCIMAACALLMTGIAGMGMPEAVSAAEKSYTSYRNVHAHGSGLMLEPTLILEPASSEDIPVLGGTSSPDTLLFTLDEEMNAVLGEEKIPFQDLFDDRVRDGAIAAVRLDGTNVDAFLGFLHRTYAISDLIAVSEDISVLEKLYADSAGRIVNTVYDLTGCGLTKDRYAEWPHIAEANRAGCNILLYDASDPNFPVVCEYVEAMTKVCWAFAEGKAEAVQAIAAGAYGLLSSSLSDMVGALSVFPEQGFARAQYIAAHRGITKYANEQSLTGIMAAYNEGATHVEIDIQITKDGAFIINHDENVMNATGKASSSAISRCDLSYLRKLSLATYSLRYGDTFATLEEVVRMMRRTDVILIIELKLDNATSLAVNELKAIETLRTFMDAHADIAGHWYAITFFEPYAEKMRAHLPEIPLGYLGAGQADMEKEQDKTAWGGGHKNMTDLGGKIAFLRNYNMGLDEGMQAATNTMAQNYLARGYTQNTWTFEDTSHFGYAANVATTNKAEECAMLVKTISSSPVTMTEERFSSGEFPFTCTAYNGWESVERCKFFVASREGNEAVVVPYLTQTYRAGQREESFGLYGMPTRVTIA